jgi:hypothetical protein
MRSGSAAEAVLKPSVSRAARASFFVIGDSPVEIDRVGRLEVRAKV